MNREEGGPISRRKRRQILLLKKCNISQFVKKKSWLPNYRINLLLFLNKSGNLIPCSQIKLPDKKCIVDTIQRFYSNLSLSTLTEICV